jgi:hypothetical protein
MSGSVMKNAMLDLRCIALRKAERGRVRRVIAVVWSTASAILSTVIPAEASKAEGRNP